MKKTREKAREEKTLKYFRLRFKDGSFKIVKGKSSLEVIKKYDLASKKHMHATIVELTGEQEAIAESNDKGQASIFGLLGIIYTGFVIVVLLVIF